jgi:hypothetical protein
VRAAAHRRGAHEQERRIAAFVHVRLEVLEQLLAALAGIDASAVQQERIVNAMAPAKRVGRTFEMRRECFATRRRELQPFAR